MRTRALVQVSGVLAVMVSALLGATLWLLPESPASAADVDELHTVDQYVAALKTDPILVQQVMGGGHTAEVRRTLTELAAKLPYRVHVALVQNPTDLQSDDITRDLASAIRRRLGEPGLYIVGSPEGTTQILVTGSAVDETLLSLAYYDVMPAVANLEPRAFERRSSSALEAQAVLEVAASPAFAHYDSTKQQGRPVLTDAQLEALAREPWAAAPTVPYVDVYESHLGKRWMVGTVTALGSFLVVGTALVGWPGWRRRTVPGTTSGSRPALETVRGDAEEILTTLATGLAELPATPAHPDLAEDALAAREAAESALRGRYLDVVGALVLARSGLTDVGRAQQQKPGKPYRACYFNPLHGRAVVQTTWRYGDADVAVPSCRRCGRAVDSGRTPDVLRVGDSATSRAYFEDKSVWASTGYGTLVDHFGATVLRDREARS